MTVLAVSALQVLEVVGLAAAGFVVVVLACAGVLAVLQLVLPSTDSGAVAADLGAAERSCEPGITGESTSAEVDTEGDA